jgi:ATP-dependent Lhr-like helicase
VVLAATDPANPYGGALPWPERAVDGGPQAGTQGRGAGRAGRRRLVLYVERGGKTLLSFRDDDTCLGPAVDALALAVRDGALGKADGHQGRRRGGAHLAAGAGPGGRRLPADPAGSAAARMILR